MKGPLANIVLGVVLLATVPLSSQDGLAPQALAKAKKGDPMAEAQIGWSYHLGLGVTQNQAEAVRWLREAADQGNAYPRWPRQCVLPRAGRPKDYGQAFSWFNKAAEQGDAFAENYPGAYYDQGLAVPDLRDRLEAITNKQLVDEADILIAMLG
jgi:TPR repeat protein